MVKRQQSVKAGAPPEIIVHGLDHARAALGAAREAGRAVRLASAPGAGAYAGGSWFAALEAEARAEFPDVEATFILDCGDEPGRALAALAAGVRHIRLKAPKQALARIADIAAQSGAVVETIRGDGLDLGAEASPEIACRHLFGDG